MKPSSVGRDGGSAPEPPLKALALALALAAAACTPAVDPAKVAAVQVAGTEAAVHGCRLLGPLEGRDNDRWVPGGPRLETAMLDLRRKAVTGGGNRLVMDEIQPPRDSDYVPTFIVRARLFACADVAVAAAPGASDAGAPAQNVAQPPSPKPAPPAPCEPECSPGYTCLRGACVSACNPVCGSGERCGADRICHPVAAVPPTAPVQP